MVCRLQEVNKQWNESPFIADNVNQLSPEARDLLDRIFVLDPSKRITIPEIMRHAWCAQHPATEHHRCMIVQCCSKFYNNTIPPLPLTPEVCSAKLVTGLIISTVHFAIMTSESCLVFGSYVGTFSRQAAGLPRYTKALRPEHQAALDKLHEEQRQVDEHLHHRKLDPVRPNLREHVMFFTLIPLLAQYFKGECVRHCLEML